MNYLSYILNNLNRSYDKIILAPSKYSSARKRVYHFMFSQNNQIIVLKQHGIQSVKRFYFDISNKYHFHNWDELIFDLLIIN